MASACGLAGRACVACASGSTCSVGSCLTFSPPAAAGGTAAGTATGGGAAGGGAAGGGAPLGGGTVRLNTCVGRYVECRGGCVDPFTDETNCGGCGVQCTAGLVCSAGQCRTLPTDCVTDRCPDDFGCNPETRTCARGCFSNADCRVAGAECRGGGCLCANTSTTPACGACGARTFSSLTCRCSAGFQSSPEGCADIDECATTSGLCGPPTAARCVNTPGSFTCECQRNFVKVSGQQCVPNLCATNNGGCDSLASCTMTSDTQVACRCPSGTIGDGSTCRVTCDRFSACPSGLSCFPDSTSPTGSSCERPGFGLERELCASNRDCSAGTFCTTQPGGVISTCTRLCQSTSGCGPSQRCINRQGISQCLFAPNSMGCDPLMQDCEEGCFPVIEDGGMTTICIFSQYVSDGQPCQYANTCRPGSICVNSPAAPMAYRCARLCDPAAPMCSGACEPRGTGGVCR